MNTESSVHYSIWRGDGNGLRFDTMCCAVLIMFLIVVDFVQPLFGEDQMLSSPAVSPPHCPVSSEIEDSDCATDKMERPSPISVLEPLFTDDDISPASTISQPG